MINGKRVIVDQEQPEKPFSLESHVFELKNDSEILIETELSGLNFIDLHYSRGTYPTGLKRFPIGYEGVGRIVEVGSKCNEDLNIGDRVVYGLGDMGTYSSHYICSSNVLHVLPPDFDSAGACAIYLRGLTIFSLLEVLPKKYLRGNVLVNAAAGGLGHLLIQVLIAEGFHVTGIVSNDEKKGWIEDQKYGCDIYTQDEFKYLSNEYNRYFDAVFDLSGKGLAEKYFSLCRNFGTYLLVGIADTKNSKLLASDINNFGTIYFVRPKLPDFLSVGSFRSEAFEFIKNYYSSGSLKPVITEIFDMTDVHSAHNCLGGGFSKGISLIKTQST